MEEKIQWLQQQIAYEERCLASTQEKANEYLEEVRIHTMRKELYKEMLDKCQTKT